ncbi:MAG: nuclear transport factor 2 family protein [Chloroflexi bacterium]|nr:nuclear transport factor 2 family protein [Chloroflexota bacterium]
MAADADAKLVELEQRLQVLEDREKIRETLARYSFTADMGRSREYVENYTDDGTIDLGPSTKWSGHEELTDFITDPAGGHKAIEGRCMHTSVNTFIRIEGDAAWAEGYSVVYTKEGGGEREGYGVYTLGYNHWTFKRKDGRWLLAYRHRRPVGGDEWGGDVIKEFLGG